MIGQQVRTFLRKNARMAHISACPPPQTSIIGGLLERSSYPRIPLSEPIGEEGSFSTTGVDLGEVKETTLSNGLTVRSYDYAAPLARITLTVDSGSRYEDSSNHGVNSFLATFTESSTENRSAFRYVRENDMLGNSLKVAANRESIVYTATALQDHVAHAMGSLGDVLAHPVFEKAELAAGKDRYREFISEEMDRNPNPIEAIHAAAFHGNTLGNPLLARYNDLDSLSAGSLQAHLAKFATGTRMTISAVGVEHGKLCDTVAMGFAGVPQSGPEVIKLPAKYTGGEFIIGQSGEDGLIGYTLGFEAPSAASGDLVPALVLRSLLGGDSAVTSKLFAGLADAGLESVESRAFIYSDSGLFTISGTAASSASGALTDYLVKTALTLPEVSADEVEAAKKRLYGHLLLASGSPAAQAEALGSATKGDAELAAAVEAVTVNDVQRVATTMIQTTLSSSAIGDITYIPQQATIASNFTALPFAN